MVLEAWEGAEQIGFPVVGEDGKDASNVIDYDINKEVTIDTSATRNANNETTTGEATLTYGVNEPKIIDDTSIHDILNKGKSIAYASGSHGYDAVDNDWHYWLLDMQISSQEGPYLYQNGDYYNGYTWISGRAIIIPKTGQYSVSVTFEGNVNVFYHRYRLYINEEEIITFEGSGATVTQSTTIAANAGDELGIYIGHKFTGTPGGGYPISGWCNLTLTKIG